MGKVVVGLSMSLDGFIAGPHDGPDNHLVMAGAGSSTGGSWAPSASAPTIAPAARAEPGGGRGDVRLRGDRQPEGSPDRPGLHPWRPGRDLLGQAGGCRDSATTSASPRLPMQNAQQSKMSGRVRIAEARSRRGAQVRTGNRTGPHLTSSSRIRACRDPGDRHVTWRTRASNGAIGRSDADAPSSGDQPAPSRCRCLLTPRQLGSGRNRAARRPRSPGEQDHGKRQDL